MTTEVADRRFAPRTQMLNPPSLAPAAEDGTEPGGSSSFRGGEREDVAVDWDLAGTHKRNEELRQRDSVKEVFAKVKNITSLWDQETRDWIGSLPHYMRREAIPLFENSYADEDYQLHPSYSWLTSGKSAKDPDPKFYHLSCGEDAQPLNADLFMPLGRLFVNAKNDDRFNERVPNSGSTRLTRWTGYEVFISTDLSLWIAFDEKSLASHASPWYPVSCDIAGLFEPHSSRGTVRLLDSLGVLGEDDPFGHASAVVKATTRVGMARLHEVEKSAVKRRVGKHEVDEEISLFQPEPSATTTTAGVKVRPETSIVSVEGPKRRVGKFKSKPSLPVRVMISAKDQILRIIPGRHYLSAGS
jgi:hypothetical protein